METYVTYQEISELKRLNRDIYAAFKAKFILDQSVIKRVREIYRYVDSRIDELGRSLGCPQRRHNDEGVDTKVPDWFEDTRRRSMGAA